MDGVRDGISGLPVTLDALHSIGHGGMLWHVHHDRIDTGFDTAATMDLLLVAGDRPIHLFWAVTVWGGRARFDRIRNVTASGNGNALSILGTNDELEVPRKATAFHTPTGLSDLTNSRDPRILFASTSGQARTTSSERPGEEVVIARNMKHLFRVTALDDDIQASIDIVAYER